MGWKDRCQLSAHQRCLREQRLGHRQCLAGASTICRVFVLRGSCCTTGKDTTSEKIVPHSILAARESMGKKGEYTFHSYMQANLAHTVTRNQGEFRRETVGRKECLIAETRSQARRLFHRERLSGTPFGNAFRERLSVAKGRRFHDSVGWLLMINDTQDFSTFSYRKHLLQPLQSQRRIVGTAFFPPNQKVEGCLHRWQRQHQKRGQPPL